MDNLVNELVEDNTESVSQSLGLYGYHCNDCGTNFLSKTENNNICDYCGSNNVTDLNANINNCSVIPFNKKIEEAKEDYRKHTRFNPLIPFSLKSKKYLNNMKKIYYLTYIVDGSVSGNIEYLATDKNKKVVQEYNVSYDTSFDYTKCLININKKISKREFFNTFKCSLDTLQEFRMSILEDETIILSDCTDEEIIKKIQTVLGKNSIDIVSKDINHKKHKVTNNNLNTKIDLVQPVLIPIYLMNMKYRNKEYHYLYNGVDGKVYYKYPIGIIETIIFGLLVFGIVFLLGYLISIII